MSATANWSYTNTATIRPFISIEDWSGKVTYGPEFEIACTWSSVEIDERNENGSELVIKHEVFTEDPRPKRLDQIRLNGSDVWEEIRDVTSWDMSFFGEIPDYKLITG